MAFRTKRGRPRKPLTGKDSGTPELRMKRALGITMEPLDLCLARGLVDKGQHHAGVHFRWLYTLRFGTPTVRALDPLHFGGRELKHERHEWNHRRENEYRDASTVLQTAHAFETVRDICVFSHVPPFLHPVTPADATHDMRTQFANSLKQNESLIRLREGLSALERLWSTGRSSCHPPLTETHHV